MVFLQYLILYIKHKTSSGNMKYEGGNPKNEHAAIIWFFFSSSCEIIK
jgi:hypothetical protein